MGSSRVIKPKRTLIFNAPAQRAAITETLEKTAKDIQSDFDKTVATWQHSVSFPISVPSEFERLIATTDMIYGMLDAGTSAHIILPKRSKLLRFQTPFQAKTTPRSIGSGAGSIGGNVVWSRGVMHPGTEPREWAITIALKWRDISPGLMQRAITRAVK